MKSPNWRRKTPAVKKLPPEELAHEQLQETEAFLRLARPDLQRHGVRNCEAIELGLREALLKDGRRWLEQLYAEAQLCVPDNASRPGEKSHPNRKLQMHSIFGVVELRRDYFYSPAMRMGRFPLDEALGLVESFSPALVRLAARAAAREGCQAASEDLAALAGISMEGRFPSAICILDLYHVLERLHDLCQGLYASQSTWAARTEEKWKEMLKAIRSKR